MKKTTFLLIPGFILLWNSGFIGAEFGLAYTGPFTLLFWRYLALSLILVLYLLLRKRLLWVGWMVATSHMLIGVLAHGLWLTCVLLALNSKVPAGIVALIVALQPLATGALSGIVTGEKTSFYQWLGLFLGFLGVVLTVGFRIDYGSHASVIGYLLPLGSVIGITAASLIQRRMEIISGPSKLPLDLSLFYQSVATTAVLAVPAIIIEKLSTQWSMEFIYIELWLVLAVSFGAYLTMWLLIKRIEATRVASLFYLGPPVTMLMAWLAFGDTVQNMDIAGLAVVFVGVFFAQFTKEEGR